MRHCTRNYPTPINSGNTYVNNFAFPSWRERVFHFLLWLIKLGFLIARSWFTQIHFLVAFLWGRDRCHFFRNWEQDYRGTGTYRARYLFGRNVKRRQLRHWGRRAWGNYRREAALKALTKTENNDQKDNWPIKILWQFPWRNSASDFGSKIWREVDSGCALGPFPFLFSDCGHFGRVLHKRDLLRRVVKRAACCISCFVKTINKLIFLIFDVSETVVSKRNSSFPTVFEVAPVRFSIFLWVGLENEKISWKNNLKTSRDIGWIFKFDWNRDCFNFKATLIIKVWFALYLGVSGNLNKFLTN